MQSRKQNRLKDYDYRQQGAYFVTICTQDHAYIFSIVVVGGSVPARPHVELTNIGRLIGDTIKY